jgi:hypothetical protein
MVTTQLAPGAILSKGQCPITPEEIADMQNPVYRELIGFL